MTPVGKKALLLGSGELGKKWQSNFNATVWK